MLALSERKRYEAMTTRAVPLQGGINFRDLGGYQNRQGRSVVWRRLFRSGHLALLTDEDLVQLEQFGVTEVHDFRRREEQERNPSKPISARFVADYQMYVGSLSLFWQYLNSGELTAATAHELVVSSYRDCIDDVIPAYRKLFRHLLANRDHASLFHCSAGKDRTGMAAALILSALDVPRQIIIEDYLLTQTHLDTDNLIERVEGHLRAAGVSHWERSWLVPYCTVDEENILTFFNAIERGYGSVANYLQQGLGLSEKQIQQLQTIYLTER